MPTPLFDLMGPIWAKCGAPNMALPHVAHIGSSGAKYEKINMALPRIAHMTPRVQAGGSNMAMPDIIHVGHTQEKRGEAYK